MNIMEAINWEDSMARAILEGVVEIGSLVTFATMVAILALAMAPMG